MSNIHNNNDMFVCREHCLVQSRVHYIFRDSTVDPPICHYCNRPMEPYPEEELLEMHRIVSALTNIDVKETD